MSCSPAVIVSIGVHVEELRCINQFHLVPDYVHEAGHSWDYPRSCDPVGVAMGQFFNRSIGGSWRSIHNLRSFHCHNHCQRSSGKCSTGMLRESGDRDKDGRVIAGVTVVLQAEEEAEITSASVGVWSFSYRIPTAIPVLR